MNDLVGPLVLGLLTILGFLVAWGCYSLRDFSRSQLEEVCERGGKNDRFGVILRTQEHALVAADIVLAIVGIAWLSLAFQLLGLWAEQSIVTLGWLVYTARFVVLGSGFLASFVVFPWTMSRVAGETYLGKCWPLFATLRSILSPFLALLFKLDQIVHRLGGVQEPGNGDGETIAEEIRSVVDEGQREGLLQFGAGTMIHRVMELQEEDAAAIMTPRTDMVCIQAETELEEARTRLLEAGHSRVPVYGESTDDIIGVLYAKDLLRHIADSNGQTPLLRDIVREPFYVPETSGIGSLLETMKHTQVQLAIVLDEYGGVAGLVTMEDILEEIVGEIADEFDPAEKQVIKQLDAQTYEVDARVHIDDLNDQFQYNLPEDDDFDTIGGFVFSQLGRVPTADEEVTWRQLRITVLDADKRKINRLRLQIDTSLTESFSE